MSSNAEKLKIWRNMTPAERDYDRLVAKRIPYGASWAVETEGGAEVERELLDNAIDDRGCSCHICAPCSWCTGEGRDE